MSDEVVLLVLLFLAFGLAVFFDNINANTKKIENNLNLSPSPTPYVESKVYFNKAVSKSITCWNDEKNYLICEHVVG